MNDRRGETIRVGDIVKFRNIVLRVDHLRDPGNVTGFRPMLTGHELGAGWSYSVFADEVEIISRPLEESSRPRRFHMPRYLVVQEHKGEQWMRVSDFERIMDGIERTW